jgi:hypothetical protein
LTEGQPLFSFWGTVARGVAPEVGVFVFAIVSLGTFLFVFCREWLVRPEANDGVSTQRWHIPASFWLPASVLFGAASGIIIGVMTALFAPVLKLFYDTSSQIVAANFNSLIFVVSGIVLLAALLQYAYEVFFGWTPFRGGLRGQPYKYKMKEIFHRLGVTFGLVTACLGLVFVIAAIATRDVSAFERLNISIYVFSFVIVASLIVYWLMRLFGWLLEGDIVIISLIIGFSFAYWLYRIFSFLRRWVGGEATRAYPAGSRSIPPVALQRVDIKKSYELRRYHDQRFLWVPMFSTVIGMILLLVRPLFGAFLLIAVGISLLWYLKGQSVDLE